MNIQDWYSTNFESRLAGRYVTLDTLDPILKELGSHALISEIGTSEFGIPIPMITIGSGTKKVLAWSQMHGNESTTTKAIFDLLKLFSAPGEFVEEIASVLSAFQFRIIPILNPDGAKMYTRENGNGIDLNRDAQNLSQSESIALREVFDSFTPDLCLNMHDQRTIYGLLGRKSATVSFLAPAADPERSVTPARLEAMGLIAKMNKVLQHHIPGGVGRYDDAFNANCVGDTFQMMGVPTILFEAGHFPGDYERERTREMIFYALFSLFFPSEERKESRILHEYNEIPENRESFRDVVIRNVLVNGEKTSLAVQYEERLKDNNIDFQPLIDKIGELAGISGHLEIDGEGASILLNHQEKVNVGDNVSTIVDKNEQSRVIFSKF